MAVLRTDLNARKVPSKQAEEESLVQVVARVGR